ncbi:glutamate racemase [Croceivirga lutea]|uniref:glutamate racemase n=1 Tax=Croceivirga lutea TaxID=1775167 RepID=UPI0016395007|nr:glutamate racemase [Croceivirga lutea]GGG53939.1 glutamate racemase [Croceivirga lutea]
MSNNPIGIFDSGVGGTSIWKEINRLLPYESTIYLADSANAPYGLKTNKTIIELSTKNVEYLLARNCKLIVVACNTATTNAIKELRANYNIPFIGIEPAIKPAALNTKTKKVGVLATKGTLSSGLFQNTSKIYASGIEVIEQEGNGLVELVEAGSVNSKKTYELLKTFITPMLEKGIDSLVLGCTHYPYLIPVLKKILPPEVKIIDSGFAVAKQTKSILQQQNLDNTNSAKVTHYFYSNKNPYLLKTIVDTNKNAEVSYLDF